MKLYYWLKDWQLPGQQHKGASRVEIPTDAGGLCAWLNARAVPLAPVSAPQAPEAVEAVQQPEPAPMRSDAGKTALTATQVEAFILDEASTAQVERIFAAIGTRFAEIARRQA